MDLDALVSSFKARSEVAEMQRLGDLLLAWKDDDSTVIDLDERVEDYLASARVSDEAMLDEAKRIWRGFRESAIVPICGMTMNERLSWFCLYSRFDHVANRAEKTAVYSKLLAKR
jgi:hypothetical protein